MRFDDRFLDEVKGRLRLSDVIGRTVKLRRQGREFAGLSPFNKEKSPSFFVNDDKGFFHDFSSGKHGDLVDWLRETQRLSFREAVETLAAEAGVALPAEDPREAEREQARASLTDWLETAAKYFEAQLRRPAGSEARAYLERRALPESEWPRFRLGYAPAGRTTLKDYLVAKGARPAELVETGLLIAPEGGGAPYDRFRDRIIFPIADARGRLISFGGRALNPDDRAKYLNGPETILFSKGRHLYGLQDARKLLAQPSSPASRGRGTATRSGGLEGALASPHARAAPSAPSTTAFGGGPPLPQAGEEGRPDDPALVVVEGYFDVIAAQRSGVAAIAAMGTALTEDQMALLWRSHPEPTLSFDGDAAGLRAAWKTLDRALPLLQPGRSFQFALLTGCRDPDDILRQDGPAALKATLAATRPFVDVLFEREKTSAEPLDTPERRAGLKANLRKLAATIADRDLSQAYRDALLERFENLFRLSRPADTYSQAARELANRRWDGRRRVAPITGASAEARTAAVRLQSAMRPLTAAVAQAIVLTPDLIDEHLETFATQGFRDAALQPLADAVVRLRLAGEDPTPADLRQRFDAAGLTDLLARIAEAADRAGAPFLSPDLPPETARRLWNQAFDVLVRLSALDRAVDDAVADLERDADASSLMRLKAERDALRRAAASGAVFEDA